MSNPTYEPNTPLTEVEAAKVAGFGLDKPKRRTKRRYAHELYPHPADDEVRPLAVDVPYLYARALGLEVFGTGWFDVEPRDIAWGRTNHLIDARQVALLADALLQGLAGQQAWEWASENLTDETGEIVGDRAEHYGVPFDTIKPYPCGPEPDHHDHLAEPDARGWRIVTRVQGKESECDECTETVEA